MTMGNFLQKFHTTAATDNGDYPTPQMAVLTKAEIELIKETWKIPSANPIDSAEIIFYTFLERYPDNQQRFVMFKDKPLAELKGTPQFRAHASKILNSFNYVIDALDKDPDMKEIAKMVAEVGRSHAKRKITKKSYMELREVLTDILVSVCKLNDDGKTAWSKLLDIFFHIIYECIDGRAAQYS